MYLLAALTGLSVWSGVRVRAQDTTEERALAESAHLRDTGQWEAAKAALRRHLEAHPVCTPASRMLGQLLYWSRDLPAARAT